MADTSGSRLKFEFMLGGGPPVFMTYPESADSTAWDVGAILMLDSSGHLTQHTTGAAGTGCFAVATEPMAATADGSYDTVVHLITPMSVFSAVVCNATTASAHPDPAMTGKTYEVEKTTAITSATNTWVIDGGTTSNVGAYIIGMKDTSATQYGRAYFIFNKIYGQESPFYSEASS